MTPARPSDIHATHIPAPSAAGIRIVRWIEKRNSAMQHFSIAACLAVLSGLLSAAVVAFDLRRRPQPMRIMNAVWILTPLWSGAVGLAAYFSFGRAAKPHPAPTTGEACRNGRPAAEPDGTAPENLHSGTRRTNGTPVPLRDKSCADSPHMRMTEAKDQSGRMIADMPCDKRSEPEKEMHRMSMTHATSGMEPDGPGAGGPGKTEMHGMPPHATKTSTMKTDTTETEAMNTGTMNMGTMNMETMNMETMNMGAPRPRWQSAVLSTLHCGAGCTLADLTGEWFLYFVPVAVGGSLLAGTWITDYLLALVFGIGFQYAAIRGMERIPRGEAVVRAAKADFLSLTAWQAGMYGWMAVAIFVLGDGAAFSRTTFRFWFMMQIAMCCGFLVSLPVNVLLIRKGIKKGM